MINQELHEEFAPVCPERLAITIAVLLDREPAMAAQIKQFIPEARLVAVLGLSLAPPLAAAA